MDVWAILYSDFIKTDQVEGCSHLSARHNAEAVERIATEFHNTDSKVLVAVG